jgi:anti-anti-sigma factor
VAEGLQSPRGGSVPASAIKCYGKRAFRIVGDLDASSAGELLCGMEAEIEPGGDLVIDLADLDSADCSGATVLAEIASRIDGDLILFSPPPEVVVVLETAKICERHPNVVVFCTHRPSA